MISAHTPRRSSRSLITAVVATGLCAVASPVATASPTSTATPAGASVASRAAAPIVGASASRQSARRKASVRIAASRRGTPYRYGAEGPTSFDCSGLVMWSWAKVGRSLPRTAQGQYRATMPISRHNARVGDLVFFGNRYKHHVGIYTGNWTMLHAPRTGTRVRVDRIYSNNVTFGRVR